MKRLTQYIVLFLAVLAFVPMQAFGAKPEANKPFVVVIDAGHGGKDAGAVGKLAKEKDLNLSVSLMLEDLIKNGYSDVKVYMTRTTDVFLSLQERANFVNKHNADLFICIHTNAAESRAAKGAETFVLGVDKMESNLNVAMRENAVMMLEDDYQTKYNGFDPKSVDSYIMFEMMQDQYIDQSIQYATLVQQQFCGVLHRADRGVRQAGFWVLHKSACPSVLVEMGFISNAEEEQFLASIEGKRQIANAIFMAFIQYKSALERRAGKTVVEPKIETPQEPNLTNQPNQPNSTNQPNQPDQSDNQPAPVAEQPVYRVQIFSTTAPLKTGDPTFRGLKGCQYTHQGKFYKYTYGEETDYDKIIALQQQLKAKFKDCFVVAFYQGKQIPVKDARNIK